MTTDQMHDQVSDNPEVASGQLDGIAATMRRCTGSERYGIPAHDALTSDFPVQPSSRDGLGRMCKPHWREYTNGLRRDDLARKAGGDAAAPTATYTQNVEAAERRRAKVGKAPKPVAAVKPAKVAKPKAERKPRGVRTGQEAPAIEEARAIVAATEKLGGRAYLDAVASDEVQDALRILASTSAGPAIHEAMRERFESESWAQEDEPAEAPAYEDTLAASMVGEGEAIETPLGETIDGGTEEADASTTDAG